jgi:hypothetical protein
VSGFKFIERRTHEQALRGSGRGVGGKENCKEQCVLYLAFVSTKNIHLAHTVHLFVSFNSFTTITPLNKIKLLVFIFEDCVFKGRK